MLRLKHVGLICIFFLIFGASNVLAQTVNCTGVPQWELPTIYNIGDRVVFENNLYECTVPSQIVTPVAAPDRWRLIGPCDGAPPPPPPPPPQGVSIVGSWIAGTT